MYCPDPNLLLFAYNNEPDQYLRIIRPILTALRSRFDGDVIGAHLSRLRLALDDGAGGLCLTLDDRTIAPGRVLARTFSSPYGTLLAETLRVAGAVVCNDPSAVRAADSKFHTAVLLAAAGLPVPEQSTAVAFRHEVNLAAATSWPRVLKTDTGFGGAGVQLAQNPEHALNLISSSAEAVHVSQQFLPEAAGTDVRVLVVGGEVVAAIRRVGTDGDFRANITQGGAALPVELTARERVLAVRAATALGLTVAGIDLLRTNAGPVVLEVNANPGLSAMEHVTGPHVYDALAAGVINA